MSGILKKPGNHKRVKSLDHNISSSKALISHSNLNASSNNKLIPIKVKYLAKKLDDGSEGAYSENPMQDISSNTNYKIIEETESDLTINKSERSFIIGDAVIEPKSQKSIFEISSVPNSFDFQEGGARFTETGELLKYSIIGKPESFLKFHKRLNRLPVQLQSNNGERYSIMSYVNEDSFSSKVEEVSSKKVIYFLGKKS